MKKTVSLFLVALISSVSIMAFAAPINQAQCMYRCGWHGGTLAACKDICGVP
ncbi:hypothetical protein H8K33_16680 [Undibacterium amnicola]|uniref:Uncharacterized protein n=1 Tax=Undibacterium amnicola TaxID=1834038 RepID=A0ABR6XUL2_9BURK|nr:hypothetical protein [Undibacterium amnicola]MBC3833146.1 hypothetical protein [Undibacterium amnicola]